MQEKKRGDVLASGWGRRGKKVSQPHQQKSKPGSY